MEKKQKRRRLNIDEAVDFVSVVSTYFKKQSNCPLAIEDAIALLRRQLTEAVVHCKKKKFTLTFRNNKGSSYAFRNICIASDAHEAFNASHQYWVEQHSTIRGPFLCTLKHTKDHWKAQSYFFYGLQQANCTEETLAKFAASQLLGSLVKDWVDLLQALYSYTPDIRQVPSLDTKEIEARLEHVFQTVKFLRHYPTEPRDISGEQALRLPDNVLQVHDLYAETFAHSWVRHVYRRETHLKYVKNAHLRNIAAHFINTLMQGTTKKLQLTSTDYLSCQLMNDRYAVVSGHITVHEERVLPEHLAHQSGSSLEQAARWTFRVLKYFNPTPNGGTLLEIQEKFKTYPIFTVYDMAKPTFEEMVVYQTQDFQNMFGSVMDLMQNIPPVKYSLRCLWDMGLRPIWKGVVPTTEFQFQGKTFVQSVYMHPGKRYYISVYVEKPSPEGIDILVESAVPAIQEEVPDSKDWMATMHQWYRFLTRKPTQPHDPAALHTFLTSVRAKHPESDTVMLRVVDWYCSNLSEATVYESPALVERYGTYHSRKDRIKQGCITFHKCYEWLKNGMSGKTLRHFVKMLRLDNQTLDSMTLIGHNSYRYYCTVHMVVESVPYVNPPTQSSWWGENFSFD